MLRSLEVLGLRGFATKQRVTFALAGGPDELGLTVIVGANNSGKSTIIEAMRALAQGDTPSFSTGRRNIAAGDQVEIVVENEAGKIARLKSIRSGTSECTYDRGDVQHLQSEVLALPSRRVFSPYFHRSSLDRGGYMANIGFPTVRSTQVESFAQRLFQIEKNREEFDQLLEEVVGEPLVWSIDQSDQGQHFLKVSGRSGGVHTSEGMGEGLISLMYMVDAFYDSKPGQVIVIDEPELSLHPQYQKRLLQILLRYAETRQIITSTHSPYFVDMGSLAKGMRIHRVTTGKNGSIIHTLTEPTAKAIAKFVLNDNNPHIVGISAREALFAGDRIVLLEGQEDVIFLERAMRDIGLNLKAQPFGWGVGGAENMPVVARMLLELGFEKVVGILDSDKKVLRDDLRKLCPKYLFECQPAKDIRTKAGRKATDSVSGLLDDSNEHVRPQHKDAFIETITSANAYLAKE
jgi:predicted ATPase